MEDVDLRVRVREKWKLALPNIFPLLRPRRQQQRTYRLLTLYSTSTTSSGLTNKTLSATMSLDHLYKSELPFHPISGPGGIIVSYKALAPYD